MLIFSLLSSKTSSIPLGKKGTRKVKYNDRPERRKISEAALSSKSAKSSSKQTKSIPQANIFIYFEIVVRMRQFRFSLQKYILI